MIWNDFYKFEELVENQEAYELEIIDENTSYSLKQFSQKISGNGGYRNDYRSARNENR